ncbi:MAG: PD-(D/E)XK nuclease family protein, partial [Candidatus Nanoarchaeia archaeon]
MIRKAKSIEELYEEVKDFDLVITNDAPLNTALNRLINKTHLGEFALTSKMIGSKYSNYIFEEEQLKLPQIVMLVQQQFNLNLKEALFHTKNIFAIWQYVGTLDKCIDYASQREVSIIEFLKKLPSYQLSMQNMDLSFLQKNNIAVIGEELFNELDTKVLTHNYTPISMFKDNEEHTLDTVYMFESQKDIVDRVVSMITTKNQNSVAIALDIESDYLPLLKAKLINNNIELNEKLLLAQEFRTREFLSIVESLFTLHNNITKDFIPIGSIFGIEIDTVYENSYFVQACSVSSSARALYKLLIELKHKTFQELIQTLHDYTITLPKKLIQVLQDLKLYESVITYSRFLDLKYFIENFDEEIETNKRGVLLIDAKNSIYINRDIIFYVGVDHSWVKTIDKQDYIDTQQELDKNVTSFEILLQQGQERFICVPKSYKGEDVTPPYYFNFLYNTNVEKYSQDLFEIKYITNNFESNNYVANSNSIKNSAQNIELDAISNSALNKFSQCPKKYSYSKLIQSADKEHFLKGNLIHAFAEFYFNHKEFVLKKNLDEFVQFILKQLELFSNPLQNEMLQTQITLACKSVIEFIDSLTIDENMNIEHSKQVSKKNQENIFANHYNLEIYKHNAELEFKDTVLQLLGIIDLAVNDSLIIDYKTGKKKKPSDIVERSNFKEIVTQCDFQPLVYLSTLRKITPNQNLDFWYNFPMIDMYEKIMNKKKEDNTVKVHYISSSFEDYFFSNECFSFFYKNSPKYAIPILDILKDFSFFQKLEISDESIKDTDSLSKNYLEEFYSNLVGLGLKDMKTNKDSSLKVLKNIFNFKYTKNKFKKEVFYFKEDIEEFEEYVKESVEKVNE